MLKQILPDCTNILSAGLSPAYLYLENYQRKPENSSNVFIECRVYNDDDTYTVIYRNQTVASVLYEAFKKVTGSTDNMYENKYKTDFEGNIIGGMISTGLKLEYSFTYGEIFDELESYIQPIFENILTATGQPSELLRDSVVNNKRIRIFFHAIGFGGDRRKNNYAGISKPSPDDNPLKFRKGIHRP